MSIEINLLPWREELRARRSKRFYWTLALAAAVGLGGGYGTTWYYEQEHAAQQQRNAHIQDQSQGLDEKIREINELEAQRDIMAEQEHVFRELQNERPLTVLVFSDLASSLVDGIHYTELTREGGRLELVGLAENNRQVTDQMRALAAVGAFTEPVLSEVQAEEEGGAHRFGLSMDQRLPGTADDQGALAGGEP